MKKEARTPTQIRSAIKSFFKSPYGVHSIVGAAGGSGLGALTGKHLGRMRYGDEPKKRTPYTVGGAILGGILGGAAGLGLAHASVLEAKAQAKQYAKYKRYKRYHERPSSSAGRSTGGAGSEDPFENIFRDFFEGMFGGSAGAGTGRGFSGGSRGYTRGGTRGGSRSSFGGFGSSGFGSSGFGGVRGGARASAASIDDVLKKTFGTSKANIKTKADFKKAFYRAAQKVHPDHAAAGAKAEATRKFTELKKMYDELQKTNWFSKLGHYIRQSIEKLAVYIGDYNYPRRNIAKLMIPKIVIGAAIGGLIGRKIGASQLDDPKTHSKNVLRGLLVGSLIGGGLGAIPGGILRAEELGFRKNYPLGAYVAK